MINIQPIITIYDPYWPGNVLRIIKCYEDDYYLEFIIDGDLRRMNLKEKDIDELIENLTTLRNIKGGS
jgi:hypothetical protein